MTNSNTEVKEIRRLTGIRGFAAFLILALHYNQAFPGVNFADYIPLISHGHVAVDFFFMLSGFILMHNYSSRFKRYDLGSHVKFLLRRLGRLYPAHVVALLATLSLWFIARGFFAYHFNEPHNWRLGDLIYHFTLTHAWGFEEIALWNTPSWAISSEFLAYILFPFLVLGITRAGSTVSVVSLLAGLSGLILVVYGLLGVDVATSFKGWRAVFRIAVEFSSGILLYQLADRTGAALNWGRLFVASALGFIAVPYVCNLDVLMIFLCGCMIFFLYKSEGRTETVLGWGKFVYLGKISYSLYIIHFPVQLVLMFVYRKTGMVGLGLGMQWLWYLFSMAVAWSCGAILFHLVEEPLRDVFRGRLRFS